MFKQIEPNPENKKFRNILWKISVKVKNFTWLVFCCIDIIVRARSICKSGYKVIKGYCKYNRLLEKDEIFVICCFSIGEIYLFCALLDEFLKINTKKKVSLIVKSSHKDIPKMLSKNVYRMFIDDDFNNHVRNFYDYHVFSFLLAPLQPNIFLNVPFFLKHNTTRKQIFHFFGLGQEDSVSDGLYIHDYKKALGLPMYAKLAVPKISQEVYNSVEEKLKKLGTQKSVILFTEAYTLKFIDYSFWNNLVLTLSKKGFIVYVNETKNSHLIKNAKSLTFSLGETIPICEHFKNVIALRSGICDLISTANCQIHVLYCKRFPYSTEEIRRKYTLNNYQTQHFYEYDINRHNKNQDIIDKIVFNIINTCPKT